MEDEGRVNATVFPTAAAFLDAVGAALARHGAEHHLVLGVAQSVAGMPAPNSELFAVAVTDDRGLVAAAIMTGNRPLLIASDRDSLADTAPVLCDELAKVERTPSHAIGAVGQVEAIAAEWRRRTRREPRLAMRASRR